MMTVERRRENRKVDGGEYLDNSSRVGSQVPNNIIPALGQFKCVGAI